MRLILVLVFVLIFCGGNGIGILLGALIWKKTGSMAGGITAMLIITIAAFALAMLVISLTLKSIAADATNSQLQSYPADEKTIPDEAGKKGSENE